MRVLAIDYGQRRCGVAVTDPLQIAANSLPVVRSCDVMQFICEYCASNEVERILVGLPRKLNGEFSDSYQQISRFVAKLEKILPAIPIEWVDERFTSAIAHRDMITAGFKKSTRRRKGLADEMAATIILNTWLECKNL